MHGGRSHSPRCAAGSVTGTGTGLPADQCSDILSFGSILCEMMTDERAFRGASSVETMNGIPKDLGLFGTESAAAF